MAHKGWKNVHEDRVGNKRIITWTDGMDFYYNPKGTAHYTRVDPRKYCPKAPRGLKEVEQPIPDYVYVKSPRCWAWEPEQEQTELEYLRLRFLREAMVFEKFRRGKGHANIATYHGCIVRDGLIRGICMSKYVCTLQDAVNPEYVGKGRFRYGVTAARLDHGRDLFMTTLRRGVRHLHGLGMSHCDIKPQNVGIRSDGTATLIDMDSCVEVGTSLRRVPVGRTRGWHDPTTSTVTEDWDLQACDEIEEWLSDRPPHSRRYRFREQ